MQGGIVWAAGGTDLFEMKETQAWACRLFHFLISDLLVGIIERMLELCNEATTLTRKYSREFWGKALDLAHLYGWKPLGTRPPLTHDFQLLNADWPGTYLTNDGQIVMGEDALALARALEKAMDDIPDANAEMDWNPKFWLADELPEWLSPAERRIIEEGLQEHSHDVMDMHPFEFFAGAEKEHLRGFIRFCRLGSFTIL